MPNQPRRTYSTRRARKLRRDMTEEELLLWWYLSNKQMATKFRRQVPIGRYIVDFASYDLKLIVEVDGIQHGGS